MCFESSKPHEIKKWQSAKLKDFKTNIWSFYQNILQEMGRNSSQTILHFQTTWKMSKQILSWYSKFNTCLQVYFLQIPNFSTKKNLWSYWKWQTSEGTTWPFFMTSKNKDLYSFQHICFLYLLSRKFFFKNM